MKNRCKQSAAEDDESSASSTVEATPVGRRAAVGGAFSASVV
jgi:hypothetical protein